MEEGVRKYINTQILCIYIFANLYEFWECSNDLQALYSKPTPSSKMFYIPEALRSKGSGSINSTTGFMFMPLLDIYSIVQEYVQGMQKNFQELSRLIYQLALENNQILLTLQIGGMDEDSNDPMHDIFVLQEQLRLHNWFPIILEPVPTNFHKLTLNYAEFQDKRGLPGTAIRQYAITSEHNSLVLGRSKMWWGGTVITSGGATVAPIGIVQIDVEGFEVFILQSMMDELSD